MEWVYYLGRSSALLTGCTECDVKHHNHWPNLFNSISLAFFSFIEYLVFFHSVLLIALMINIFIYFWQRWRKKKNQGSSYQTALLLNCVLAQRLLGLGCRHSRRTLACWFAYLQIDVYHMSLTFFVRNGSRIAKNLYPLLTVSGEFNVAIWFWIIRLIVLTLL